jgi:hypothetical protein
VGIPDIIGKKAKEIGAHSVSIAHHRKTMVQVWLSALFVWDMFELQAAVEG